MCAGRLGALEAAAPASPPPRRADLAGAEQRLLATVETAVAGQGGEMTARTGQLEAKVEAELAQLSTAVAGQEGEIAAWTGRLETRLEAELAALSAKLAAWQDAVANDLTAQESRHRRSLESFRRPPIVVCMEKHE
jgi:hypothetical protein